MTDVFAHPWLGGLFGDDAVAALLAPEAQLTQMIAVESAYARALGAAGVAAEGVARRAAQAIDAAQIDWEALRVGTARDGMPVPDLVRQLRGQVPEALQAAVHVGMTSQDVIDTALVLALRGVLDVFDARLTALEVALDGLVATQGPRALMGRTRMQTALPITVADRVATWRRPLTQHAKRLAEMRPRVLQLQLGGPVGVRDGQADAVAAAMAVELGLSCPPKAWHAMRDGLGELAGWLSLVSGSLGKMGQDMALMAQQGVDEIVLLGGGGSSAMAHKRNPVLAELLVSLARYNAVQLGGMHQALVHEQERSGSAWTLEWMILPGMLQATGRGLTTAAELVESIVSVGSDSL